MKIIVFLARQLVTPIIEREMSGVGTHTGVAFTSRVGCILPPWLLTLVLGAGMCAPLAAQQATQPDLEQAQTLIAQGDAAQAFELLAPFEPQFAGDLQFDYLLARSALES